MDHWAKRKLEQIPEVGDATPPSGDEWRADTLVQGYVTDNKQIVAVCPTEKIAAQIVRDHNAHRKLVTALERVETKSRNQTRSKSDAVDTLLEIGDIARAALALAEVQP